MSLLADLKRLAAPIYLSLIYALGRTYTRSISGVTCRFPASDRAPARCFDTERDALQHWLDEIRPGDVMWDVGADRGIYTISSCMRYPDVQVIAFEPHPITAIRLKKILTMNGVAERTKTLNVGLGKESSRGSMDGYRIHREEGNGVSILPGTEVIDRFSVPIPDVLKIDVEGMELNVLEGLESVLSESPPRMILCEIHRDDFIPTGLSEKDVKELRGLLTRCGYEISLIDKEERKDQQSLLFAKQKEKKR